MADAPEEAAATNRAGQVAQVIEAMLDDAGLDWESPAPGSYVVPLPGTRKLSTTCSLLVGTHSSPSTPSSSGTPTRTSRPCTAGCWSATSACSA